MADPRKVVVGMSGGIDSSMAAYLLKSQGFHVEGLNLVMHDRCFSTSCADADGCASRAAAVGTIADKLGIRLHNVDVRKQFQKLVIEPFAQAYLQGITPNPCILCNKHIKFPALIEKANELFAGFIATGHYAVIERRRARTEPVEAENDVALMKGRDPVKDQSYVLYALTRDTLARLLLPLGLLTKDEVRRSASGVGISSHALPESKEICFMEKNDFPRFMKLIGRPADGAIVDITTHMIVGRHDGLHFYTIGQRKRLPALGKPFYVVGMDAAKNILYIGPREMAFCTNFVVGDLNWLVDDDWKEASGTTGDGLRCSVKVRSTMPDKPAVIKQVGRLVEVVFDAPEWAPAPGQSAVFYCDSRVIGGGIIERIERSRHPVSISDGTSY